MASFMEFQIYYDKMKQCIDKEGIKINEMSLSINVSYMMLWMFLICRPN